LRLRADIHIVNCGFVGELLRTSVQIKGLSYEHSAST
jgi:hypothetical protein